jgi:hypothetical protein
MTTPYYWKRGLAAGLIIWAVLSFLVARLDLRGKELASGNIPMETEVTYEVPTRQTDFGVFLGVIVFALFCVVPGPLAAGAPPKQEPFPADQNT